jgi:TolB-like protein
MQGMSELRHAPAQPSDALVIAAADADDADRKEQKRRKKVRSAWISFVGRIVAHITGAAATIAFGLIVVQQYGLPRNTPTPDRAGGLEPAAVRIATPGTVSIAVLPFASYARPARPELADAIADALIADLSHGGALRVVSRTSTLKYRDDHKPLHVIARELGVDLIVEGSVTSDGDRLRVIAQLIDAKRDEHLWAETFDRTLGDMLAAQAEISAAISRGVQGAVRAGGAYRSSMAPPDAAIAERRPSER